MPETTMPDAIRHIIWDWNGTLLDDAWLCVEVINGVLESRAKPRVDLESYRRTFDFPVIDYYRRLGLNTETEPFEVVSLEFVREYARRWRECRLHRPVAGILQSAAAAGFSQSILSASQQDALEEAVNGFSIDQYFSRLVGIDNTHAHGKLEQGRAWVDTLPCPPEEILLVGDTRHDHEVAHTLGLRCILVSWGHHNPERLQSCGCPVVPALDSIATLLDRVAP